MSLGLRLPNQEMGLACGRKCISDILVEGTNMLELDCNNGYNQ